MQETLLWLYLANAVFLILHEIDSAYWKEWELFGLPGGPAGFLLLHIPLLFLVLYGLLPVARQLPSGLWFSLALGAGGILAFGIHTVYLKKGKPQFDVPVSKFILAATLALSAAQIMVAGMIYFTH